MVANQMTHVLPPESISLLINYLNERPNPTEVNIAILDADLNGTYPERAYAKVDNHLGINAPDLPQLASEFRKEYALLRQSCRQIDGSWSGGSRKRVLDTTSCLLLVCPDHSTAWADRRRALLAEGENNDHMEIEGEECVLWKELDYCNLLFTQHSKA